MEAPNPFAPPPDSAHGAPPAAPWDQRVFFLLLPPIIPFVIPFIVRVFIPPHNGDSLYHALFSLGSIVISWWWAQWMVDRLKWTSWRRYLLSSCAWGMILASSFLAQKLCELTFR